MPIGGRLLLRWCLDQVLRCPDVQHVVLVAPPAHLGDVLACLTDDERGYVDVVAGGSDRTASVGRGLAALRPDDGIVLVHDAARVLAPPELFTAVADGIRAGHAAVVPGMPVVDTIKEIDEDGYVVATPERSLLRAVQTPQGFLRETLERAHESVAELGVATDDAALVERHGVRVFVVPGSPDADKVTTPRDLRELEERLSEGQDDDTLQ